MELFEKSSKATLEPLAYRMRPRHLDQFIGQEAIIGKGKLLRRMIQTDQISSIIFYGPPGTGKTTLAQVIAYATQSNFITLNAVLSGVKELREAVEKAKEQKALYSRRTILFVDEVHRWNKAQQDALLPWVENGTVILVGATTENPFFEVNAALVSRSRIFQLKALEVHDLMRVADSALKDENFGYGKYSVVWEPGALEHLVQIANGDARTLLNALELAVEGNPEGFPPIDGQDIRITLQAAEDSIQQKAVLYDKEGDYHFDTISAFIKSLRGSDPDAAFYWLPKMVHAGESPRFIFRRMLILSCEDVGMAKPEAVSVVQSCADAFDRVGMPEGRFFLAHAALFLATCPKSNSVLGFFDALKTVQEQQDPEVPLHLRDASRDKKGFGHGEGYLYPHAYQEHWIAQTYLPLSLKDKIFYEPSAIGYEAEIKETVLQRRETQLAALLAAGNPQEEILSFGTPDSRRQRWLDRADANVSANLLSLRKAVFDTLALKRQDCLFIAEDESGILLWEALRLVPEGLVTALVFHYQTRAFIEQNLSQWKTIEKPEILSSDFNSYSIPEDKKAMYQAFCGCNLFTKLKDKDSLINKISLLLVPNGKIAIQQILPRKASRLSMWCKDPQLSVLLSNCEEVIFLDNENLLVNWDEELLLNQFLNAGFVNLQATNFVFSVKRRFTNKDLQFWFSPSGAYGKIIHAQNNAKDAELILSQVMQTFTNLSVDWQSTYALITGSKNMHPIK